MRNCQKLRSYWLISRKPLLIFSKTLLDFSPDMVDNQTIINNSIYNIKYNAFVDHSSSRRWAYSHSFFSLLCFVYTQRFIIGKLCRKSSLCSYCKRYSIETSSFFCIYLFIYLFFFCQNCVRFFLQKLFKFYN